jgi:hypothetical protein
MKEREYLVGHLVENDVDILHEESNHLVRFNFIRVYDLLFGILDLYII